METTLQIPLDHRSMTIAFADLLGRFGVIIPPDELYGTLTADDPMMDWWSLPEYYSQLDIKEVSESGWPSSDKAIVKFRRMDVAAAGPVDHYCAVADYRVHAIIDSLDGKIKSASTYGEPLGWASYENVEESALDRLEADLMTNSTPKPGTTYKVLNGGETVWEIARKLKIPNLTGVDIAEHNELNPNEKVPSGTVLHLPIAIPQKEEQKVISYEILANPMQMHTIVPAGCRKYSFGNVKNWKDVQPTGQTYPVNTNVTIVAIARVPIEEDGSEAAYYMESLALGDYASTGRVNYNIGFNHRHLGEGFVDKAKPEPRPEIQEKIKEAEAEIAAAAALEDKPKPVPVVPAIKKTMDIAPSKNFNEWKTTQRPINLQRVPKIYLASDNITVHDLDARRPSKLLYKYDQVSIYSTFEKDGVLYGRPIQSVENGNWFGIPMDKLILEDEIYNTDIPLAERVAYHGRLTPIERYWFVPLSKVLSQYTRISALINRKKQKEEVKE